MEAVFVKNEKEKSKLKSNPIARQLRTDKFRPKKVANKKTS